MRKLIDHYTARTSETYRKLCEKYKLAGKNKKVPLGTMHNWAKSGALIGTIDGKRVIVKVLAEEKK